MMNLRKQTAAGTESLRPNDSSPRGEAAKPSRYMARAVSLHLDRKPEEALKESSAP